VQLIGMLDSPYVRRVAIALQLLGLRFEHRSLSVFRAFPQMQQLNPVVKVPTLLCDDGTMLMDSGLILEYAQALAGSRRRLVPSGIAALQQCLHTEGLALAACEKSVQILYERMLRPAEKQHAPWLSRITGQVLAAYGALETELAHQPPAATSGTIDRAGISVAVAWHFTQQTIADVVPGGRYPALQAFSAQAEALAAFIAAPHGEGTCQHPA
jgi:glutathione S-transferase